MKSNFLVVYSNEQLKQYLCINTFFAFLGWFVAGKLWNGEPYTPYEKNADVIILLAGEAPEDAQNVINLIDNDGDETPDNKCQKSILEILEELKKENEITEKDQDIDVIDDVMQLYKDHGLKIIEYTSKFYFHPDIGTALEEYEKIYYEIYNLREKYGKNRIYVFVKGKIARRIQELHLEENTKTPFNIPRMIETIDNSLIDPQFVTFKYLKGCLYATDSNPELRKKYYSEMLTLLEQYKDREFKSLTNVYFRLARTGITAGRSTEEIKRWLNEAIRIDAENYRAWFRLAMIDGQNGDWNDEWDKLTMIENILSKHAILQPTEIEYAIKSKNIKSLLNRERRIDSDRAKEYENSTSVIDISKDRLVRFFQMFFDHDYEEYFDLMLRRIRNYIKREGVGDIIL